MGVVWTHEAVLVAGVCDVIADTCVAEGHTVALTVWVMVSRNNNCLEGE